METAVAFEVPAVEVRDRLVGFVEEVAARLPLRRQRENALVYVRGLVEQGGPGSVSPTPSDSGGCLRARTSAASAAPPSAGTRASPWRPRGSSWRSRNW